MTVEIMVKMILAVIGSNALFSFVQFLVTTNYAEYLSYNSTTKKFTVLKDFIAIVNAWVENESSSGPPKIGAFYINNSEITLFESKNNSEGSKGGDVFSYDFKQNDVFWSYIPSSRGWPRQHLKVYKTDTSISDMFIFDDEENA